MSTQVLVWLGAVMAGLIAMTVLGALGWAVAWSVAWVWNLWRAPDWWRAWSWWWWKLTDRSEDEYQEPLAPERSREELGFSAVSFDPPIWEQHPPERPWEQMTSHQLPVVGMSPTERKHWQRLERARKRRATRAEMGYRAHYAALGFEYPSGLVARVRELTP